MNSIKILLFVLLCVTLVIGYSTFSRRKGWLALLPGYLTVILCIELYVQKLNKAKIPSMPVYDFVTGLESIYFGMLIFVSLKNKWNKWIVGMLLFILYGSIIGYYADVSFLKVKTYNVVSFYLECLILIISGFIYLIELLKSDDVIRFNRNPIVWVVVGMIMYLGSNSFSFLTQYLGSLYKDQRFYYTIITLACNLLLYTCLSVAMLCRKYER